MSNLEAAKAQNPFKDARTEHTWERLRSTSPETPPAKITRLTSPLSSLSSSTPFPSANLEKKIPHRNHRIRVFVMDGMDSKPALNDDPSVTLTIRLIMQGKVSSVRQPTCYSENDSDLPSVS
ncbi:uncharacterized protein LOC128889642 [Hylaeus anthracinus]|uniref:uncharacterized protein LOC128889642 n=1 Tax=Hylaeus anthracinus TaxID=313031 RepID=UPI0023B91BF5|nr:uncharacterized protein LOC128889642 [Hylaeus anthracinus]